MKSWFRRPTVGLALSGGSARAMAHIGVLEAFEEAGVPIDYIAGTSAGAMIGTLYAAGYAPAELRKIASRLQWRDLARVQIPKLGLLSSDRMERFLRELIGDRDLSELKLPVAVLTTDLVSGQSVALTRGPAARAVRASASIPEIFGPVRIGPYLLVDGGITDYLPTVAIRAMGAELVIGVNVLATATFEEVPRHLMQIVLRVIGVVAAHNAQQAEAYADFIVRPDVGALPPLALDQSERHIEKGRDAGRQVAPAILSSLSRPFLRKLARGRTPVPHEIAFGSA